jgi:drug/metabolite transporter superfamily protein YnfA
MECRSQILIHLKQMWQIWRISIGSILLTVPTIQFGGYFLLTQMGKDRVIRTELQRAYYRAGHAHAGVLVLLALIVQLTIERSSPNRADS